MTNLTRWNPFRPLTRFDPASEIEDMFRSLAMRPLARELDVAAADMRMDVQEDDKAYAVSVDLPGVDKDDIDITIDRNQVKIQAELKREETREDRKRLYTERYVGTAYRVFDLPSEIERDQCKAQYDNGVLKLTLPKKQGGDVKHLTIQ